MVHPAAGVGGEGGGGAEGPADGVGGHLAGESQLVEVPYKRKKKLVFLSQQKVPHTLPGKLGLGFHLEAGVTLHERNKIKYDLFSIFLLFIFQREYEFILAKTTLPILLVQLLSEL
jgi:hypothetical protein